MAFGDLEGGDHRIEDLRGHLRFILRGLHNYAWASVQRGVVVHERVLLHLLECGHCVVAVRAGDGVIGVMIALQNYQIAVKSS